jgi:hypothetical protein
LPLEAFEGGFDVDSFWDNYLQTHRIDLSL